MKSTITTYIHGRHGRYGRHGSYAQHGQCRTVVGRRGGNISGSGGGGCPRVRRARMVRTVYIPVVAWDDHGQHGIPGYYAVDGCVMKSVIKSHQS